MKEAARDKKDDYVEVKNEKENEDIVLKDEIDSVTMFN